MFRYLSLLALMLSASSFASIAVYTDRHHPPINVPPGTRVIYLDAAEQRQQNMFGPLAKDPVQAERQAQSVIQTADWAQQQRALVQAYQGVIQAWQGDLMSGEQFPRELLEATLPYWTRFMAWTARELYQTEDRCLVQLGRLFRRLIVEPRKVRSFNLSFGRIELHMSGRDINECQYLYAYDDASLEDYLEEIMAGNLTPVRFEARVLYHNDSELNVFTRDTDVIDVEHPHVSDWQTVVSEALDWIRQERASLNKITTLRPTLKLAA